MRGEATCLLEDGIECAASATVAIARRDLRDGAPVGLLVLDDTQSGAAGCSFDDDVVAFMRVGPLRGRVGVRADAGCGAAFGVGARSRRVDVLLDSERAAEAADGARTKAPAALRAGRADVVCIEDAGDLPAGKGLCEDILEARLLLEGTEPADV